MSCRAPGLSRRVLRHTAAVLRRDAARVPAVETRSATTRVTSTADRANVIMPAPGVENARLPRGRPGGPHAATPPYAGRGLASPAVSFGGSVRPFDPILPGPGRAHLEQMGDVIRDGRRRTGD